MKKIEYFCCLLGLVLTGLACQDDDETTVIPKPEGITYGTVTDKGGNVYKTLTIGNQTWLAENFRYRPDEATAADLVTYGESYGIIPVGNFCSICANSFWLPMRQAV